MFAALLILMRGGIGMKQRRTWRKTVCLLCLLLPLFCLPVHADVGPKPSVTITLKGVEGRACWGTLLTPQRSTGPYSAVSAPDIPEGTGPGEREAWEQFFRLGQENGEGLSFLNYVDDCSDGQFNWSYRPPSEFRLALWFPETQTLLVSEKEGRYAFDSYFTLSLKGIILAEGEQTGLPLTHSYPYGRELLAFLGRVALTVGIELLIAWGVGFRSRRQLNIILIANLITQGLLNLGLNLYTYFCGALVGMAGIFMLPVYLLAELMVVAVELCLYRRLLAGREGVSRERVTAYTWAANLLSLLVGYILSFLLSGLF